MSKEIIVTHPRLIKLVEWLDDQPNVVKSFILAMVRFAVIALLGAVGMGVYILGGPGGVGMFITFLFVWFFSYLGLGKD